MRLVYDQFEADRDAMADEFIEVHQECVSKLADCYSRMADFDNALLALNLGRPANVSVNLLGPEQGRATLPTSSAMHLSSAK